MTDSMISFLFCYLVPFICALRLISFFHLLYTASKWKTNEMTAK